MKSFLQIIFLPLLACIPSFAQEDDTFVGFAIKSHSIKAEYLEFSVGVRL